MFNSRVLVTNFPHPNMQGRHYQPNSPPTNAQEHYQSTNFLSSLLTAPSHNISQTKETSQPKNMNVSSSSSSSSPLSGVAQTRCHVCGEPATNYMHYGAKACKACKAFFRRAVQNKAADDFVCRMSGSCAIEVQSRKHCPRCRYDKCIRAGMNPGWVLSEHERSNLWRKQQQKSYTGKKERTIVGRDSRISPAATELNRCSSSSGIGSSDGSSSSDESDAQLRSDKPDEVQASAVEAVAPIVELDAGGNSEIAVLDSISDLYDRKYVSVSLGQSLVKEILMCSTFGIPLSPEGALLGYKLVVERLKKCAFSFGQSVGLADSSVAVLFRQNVDMMVLLQAATFFDQSKSGLDQMMHLMGVEDRKSGMNIVRSAEKKVQLERIDYKKMNTIQTLDDNSLESRFNQLLEGIGPIVSRDPRFMKILSFIVLLTPSKRHQLLLAETAAVNRAQDDLLLLIKGFVAKQKQQWWKKAPSAFGNFVNAVNDLAELKELNYKRKFVPESGIVRKSKARKIEI